jgi:predicted regulator of Ras-like GTPase activity (Roadblock/LC7/MglB family)
MNSNGDGRLTAGSVEDRLNAAIKTAKAGDKHTARRMLLDIVESDPGQEEVWLWLAAIAKDLEEAQTYLETVLALNPGHSKAVKALNLIEQRLARQRESPPPEESASAAAPDDIAPREPSTTDATAARLCEKCGSPIPDDTSFCPKCAHIAGKPVVDDVIELASTGAVEQDDFVGVDVNAEIAPSFSISIEQAEAIDACLERMAYESEASCIILADVTGQLISERGRTAGINTQVLSALAAGELSATQEMARLVGESARFSLLLHEGEERSVYLSPAGKMMLLIVVFDGRTPIGLVRIILKNAVEELGPILNRPATQKDGATVGEALSDDFARGLEDEMDASLDAFGYGADTASAEELYGN